MILFCLLPGLLVCSACLACVFALLCPVCFASCSSLLLLVGLLRYRYLSLWPWAWPCKQFIWTCDSMLLMLLALFEHFA